jgi:hypothetical protein
MSCDYWVLGNHCKAVTNFIVTPPRETRSVQTFEGDEGIIEDKFDEEAGAHSLLIFWYRVREALIVEERYMQLLEHID